MKASLGWSNEEMNSELVRTDIIATYSWKVRPIKAWLGQILHEKALLWLWGHCPPYTAGWGQFLCLWRERWSERGRGKGDSKSLITHTSTRIENVRKRERARERERERERLRDTCRERKREREKDRVVVHVHWFNIIIPTNIIIMDIPQYSSVP